MRIIVAHPFSEHVNVTVSDPERTARLLSAIFGWHERWRGPARDGGTTIHVGSDRAYLALYTGPDGEHADRRYPKGEPLKHVGVQVDELEQTEDRAKAVRLHPFPPAAYAPSPRLLFPP